MRSAAKDLDLLDHQSVRNVGAWIKKHYWAASYECLIKLLVERVNIADRAIMAINSATKKSGRPRVSDSPGFIESFAAILPRLSGEEISQRQAAGELGISVRTLIRYVRMKTCNIDGA